MPNLKNLKNRIDSVKSTRKITSAMKMVAAAKLRKAQENVEASRPYSDLMFKMLASLASSYQTSDDQPIYGPKLLVGTGKNDTHLLVVFSSDRGLCGGFNANIVKLAKLKILELTKQGLKVKLLSVNRKATDLLKKQPVEFVEFSHEVGKTPSYNDAKKVGELVLELFEQGEFDSCSFVYNKFQSALVQTPTNTQLIPFEVSNIEATEETTADDGLYDFEPNEEELLAELLPSNMIVQMYHALLENAASEHGSRMTAMDNATRNAGEMIDKLTLLYNRTRQALITKELIEIISGAEAL